jgi:hypothetical protein
MFDGLALGGNVELVFYVCFCDCLDDYSSSVPPPLRAGFFTLSRSFGHCVEFSVSLSIRLVSRLFSLSQKHITHRVSCWSRREAAQAAHMLLAAQAAIDALWR